MMTRGSTLFGFSTAHLIVQWLKDAVFMSVQAFTVPARFDLTLLIFLSPPIYFKMSVAWFRFLRNSKHLRI